MGTLDQVFKSTAIDAEMNSRAMELQPPTTDRGAVRLRLARISGGAAVCARVGSSAARLITVPLALRTLGVEEYGIWLTLAAFLAWVSLSDLGLPSALMNCLSSAIAARDHQRVRVLISATTALLLIFGAAMTVICVPVILSPALPRLVGLSGQAANSADLRWAAFAIIGLNIGMLFLRVPNVIASAMQRGYWGAVADITSQGITVALLLWACTSHATLSKFALIMVAPGVASRIVLWAFIVRRCGRSFCPALSSILANEMRTLLHHGLMFTGGTWAEMLVMTAPNLILVHFWGPAAVPQYAVPFQCFFAIYSIACVISTPLWPAYAEASASGDHHWFADTLRKTNRVVVGATALACFALALFGRKAIALWTSSRIVPDQRLLWLLALLMVVWTWGFMNLTAVTALGFIKQRARITVFHAIANLSACVFLTPRLGPLGLAVGALIAMLCTETWMIPLTLYRNAPWAYGKRLTTSVGVAES